MGGQSVEKVSEVIRKSYGHFLKPESQLTAIYREASAANMTLNITRIMSLS
jgi:hypothetical protein